MEQAIQVSPAEDVMALSSMFSRAAQAIVEASTFPRQVEALTELVSELKADLQKAKLHASELDTTLHEVRTERDQARGERDQAKADLASAQIAHSAEVEALKATVQNHEQTIEAVRRDNDRLISERDEARKERDDHGLHAMELEDQLRTAQTKLSAIQAHFEAVFKPSPAPEVPAPEKGPEDKPWWDRQTA